MSLLTVSAQLKQWGDAAALRAQRANDPDSVASLEKAAEQFRALLAEVQQAATALEACQRQIATAQTPKPRTVRRTGGIGAFEFWRRHGIAVDAMIAAYGRSWSVCAPVEDVVLAQVPAGWRSAVTERGTRMTWRKDWRMPAARFWPGGELPVGLQVTPDYARESNASSVIRYALDRWQYARSSFRYALKDRRYARQSKWGDEAYETRPAEELAKVRQARDSLRALGWTPGWVATPPKAHDAAWHKAHGYVWDGGEWRHEIEVRNAQNRADAIEAYRAAVAEAERLRILELAAYSYGPQPLILADVEDEPFLMAAE